MNAAVWTVAGLLFSTGLGVVIFRRQLLAMLLGLELMLAAVNLTFVRSAGVFGDREALAAVAIFLAVSAAEAVVGLSLILRLLRAGAGVDATDLRELKG